MNRPPEFEPVRTTGQDEEGPPFLGSWGRLYAAVLVYLALLVIAFFVFQTSFT